ncbi:MAG TPA: TadE/TadG family type IV pilus assembly protein [Silvibacterium sp.]|nr:TadE/TadG family type IV pilus assembly protein [Silvibacterium sp.]
MGFCSEAGGTLVETALSASILLAVMMGLFEMFLALYSYHYVSYAAREGSRYAIVRGSKCINLPDCGISSDDVQTMVQGLGFPGIDSTSVVVTTTWYSASAVTPTTWTVCPSVCNAPGNLVKVSVSYPYPLTLPFIKKMTLSLSSTSEMAISQ